MEIRKKFNIKNKKLIIIALSVFIVLVIAIVLILSNKEKFNNKTNNKMDLESEMKTKVTSFYDKYIKGKIIGVHRQIVTLNDLQEQDYDISNFINSKCSLESFSYIILDDPKETDVTKIKYTVENHLECK